MRPNGCEPLLSQLGSAPRRSGPRDDFGFEPQAGSPGSEVYDRPGHVWIALLVHAHSVSVGQAKEFGDTLCVDQVLAVKLWRHELEITPVDTPANPRLGLHP
jgi:hypothetical protein